MCYPLRVADSFSTRSQGAGGYLLERIQRIRQLSNKETQIDALQELASQIHVHPNDLFVMVDAVVKRDDTAAQSLEDKYGQSLVPTLFGGFTGSRVLDPEPAAGIEPPKLKTPHGSAYFSPPVRNPKRSFVPKSAGESVSTVARRYLPSDGKAMAAAQLAAETPEAIAAAKAAGLPPGAILRLNDVLNFLLSPEAAPLVRQFDDHLVANSKLHDAPLPKNDLDYTQRIPSLRPKEPLARGLATYYFMRRYEGVLRDGMTDTARRTVMPHAIVSMMANHATEDGLVSMGALLAAMGPSSTPLLKALSVSLEHGTKETSSTRKGAKYRYLSPQVATLVTRSSKPPALDERMGGFWAIVDTFGSPTAMNGVLVARSGHLVDASDALSRAWMASGANPGFQRGKHYSADPESIHREMERGWSAPLVYRDDHDYQLQDSLHPDNAFWSGVASQFDRREGSSERILVYDDGFAMLKILHELNADGRIPPDLLSKVAAVEQTEKGALICEKMVKDGLPLEVSPTNMPRSWLKKMIEGPAIGECIAWHLERMLMEANPELKIEPKEAAIVGYGAVGRATAAALKRRGYKVFVYDKDPKVMLAAAKAGFDVGGLSIAALEKAAKMDGGLDPESKTAFDEARKKVFSHGHLSVDCTPGPGWNRDEFGLFPDKAVLANGGSGTLWQGPSSAPEVFESIGIHARRDEHLAGQDIDGGAAQTALTSLLGYTNPIEARDFLSGDPNERIDDQGLRRTSFDGKEIVAGDLAAREANYHQVVRGEGGEERLVLYGGSVVNLKYGLPPEYLQITHSLLYVSGLLALEHMNEGTPMWTEIPEVIQKKMRDLIEADLKSKGLSLLEPDFNKTPPLTG